MVSLDGVAEMELFFQLQFVAGCVKRLEVGFDICVVCILGISFGAKWYRRYMSKLRDTLKTSEKLSWHLKLKKYWETFHCQRSVMSYSPNSWISYIWLATACSIKEDYVQFRNSSFMTRSLNAVFMCNYVSLGYKSTHAVCWGLADRQLHLVPASPNELYHPVAGGGLDILAVDGKDLKHVSILRKIRCVAWNIISIPGRPAIACPLRGRPRWRIWKENLSFV